MTVSLSMIGSIEHKLKATSKDFNRFVSVYVFVLLGIYSEEKNVSKDMEWLYVYVCMYIDVHVLLTGLISKMEL